MAEHNINKQSKQHVSIFMKISIGCAIIFILLGLVATYALSGFAYTIARIRCGHQPIVHFVSFENTREYLTPTSPMYDQYAHDAFNNYYCSETAAKADGLIKIELVP